MTQGIFSTYSQGENRVTSSIIQVLKHLPVNVVEAFLAMFTSDSSKQFPQVFVQFENQKKSEDSIPDARISANFALVFEVKTSTSAINIVQMNKHFKNTKESGGTLVYLTPDAFRPKELSNDEIVWKNFQHLFDRIAELLADPTLILSERDQFLLKNLQILFDESGLLPKINEVAIVAASAAWPVYQKYGVYVCQANRSFRNVDWIGFYAEGKIQPVIAKTIKCYKNFEFTDEALTKDSALNTKLHSWLKDHSWAKGICLQVFDLSTLGCKDTITLPNPIQNDLKSKSGRASAYTQGQRYTLLADLKTATKTSEL